MVKLGINVNAGRSTSAIEYGKLTNKQGKMVLIIQRGRKSMYKWKNVQQMKVLPMEMWGQE